MLYALVCILSVAAGFAGLLALAVRREYLVVLRLPRLGLFVLERQGAQRYDGIPLATVPVAITRFALCGLALAAAEVRHRWTSRTADRAPSPVVGKA
jgi:predicted lysophospholipase L1 biosynthesis ABC-type transport system permease subunit